jgi:hypothetical protein
MKEFFKETLGDKTIKTIFIVNIVAIVTTLIYILIYYGSLPPLIPIFNQLPWGEQRLGPTVTIFFPILVSILILVINAAFCAIIYKIIPLISRMLAAISLLVGILTFLFIFRIITTIT